MKKLIHPIDFYIWIIGLVFGGMFLYLSGQCLSPAYNHMSLMLSAVLIEAVVYFAPSFFDEKKAGKLFLLLGFFGFLILLFLKNYVSVAAIEIQSNMYAVLAIWIAFIFLRPEKKT